MDAVSLIISDHRLVESLSQQMKSTRDRKTREQLLSQITEELSTHASVEEQILYPCLRRVQKSGQLADHSIHEHQEMKEALEKLRHLDVLLPEFDAQFDVMMQSVRHHVQEEESEVLPIIKSSLSHDDLVKMGELMASMKRIAPLRPHPGAPSTQPWASLTHPIAALLDRISKGVTGAA